MFIPDDEKEGRKAALEKLVDLMGGETGKRLAGLKGKPVAASVTVEKDSPLDDDDDMTAGDGGGDPGADDTAAGDEEPSEEEKAKIAELYHKFCK